MPTKEDVLRWYESVKAALAKAGIALNNPADLLRVRTMYLEKDEKYHGVDYDKKVSFGYAFMPKKLGNGEEKPEYVTKRPEILREVQTVIYPEIVKEYGKKIREQGKAFRALTDARKQKRPLYEIKRLEASFEQADIALQKAEVTRREKLDGIFAEHDRWMLTNSRVFDPEKAYEQIEELYNRAKDGLLFVEELNTEPGHLRQVVVKADGTGGCNLRICMMLIRSSILLSQGHSEFVTTVMCHPNVRRSSMHTARRLRTYLQEKRWKNSRR